MKMKEALQNGNEPYLAADGAPAAVLALVGCVLHGGGDQAVTAQQVALQTLVCEEPELTFLTVEWWPVVNHLWMNFDSLLHKTNFVICPKRKETHLGEKINVNGTTIPLTFTEYKRTDLDSIHPDHHLSCIRIKISR